MKVKPKAYSMASCGYEILYKCAKCDFQFTMANDDWHYCPCCGQEIDWGVVVRANEEWRVRFIKAINENDFDARDAMLADLDKLNYVITDGQRYEMECTEATRKANLRANIQYYLGNGWTKERLIAEGFFKEEDFEDVAE